MSTETKTKHTAEPWVSGDAPKGRLLIHDNEGGTVAEVYDAGNRARIIHCVNMCSSVGIVMDALREARIACESGAGHVVRGIAVAKIEKALRALGG